MGFSTLKIGVPRSSQPFQCIVLGQVGLEGLPPCTFAVMMPGAAALGRGRWRRKRRYLGFGSVDIASAPFQGFASEICTYIQKSLARLSLVCEHGQLVKLSRMELVQMPL